MCALREEYKLTLFTKSHPYSNFVIVYGSVFIKSQRDLISIFKKNHTVTIILYLTDIKVSTSSRARKPKKQSAQPPDPVRSSSKGTKYMMKVRGLEVFLTQSNGLISFYIQ